VLGRYGEDEATLRIRPRPRHVVSRIPNGDAGERRLRPRIEDLDIDVHASHEIEVERLGVRFPSATTSR
jgi:hypothetical protein